MVTLRGKPVGGSGAGKGSGLGSGVGQLDDQTKGFISSEIMCFILKQTHVIFDTVKESILEILVERLSAFCSEMVALVGARSLIFRDFRAYGAPNYHGEKDPIMSRRWLVDIVNAFYTSSFPKGKMSGLLPDFWRIGHEIGGRRLGAPWVMLS